MADEKPAGKRDSGDARRDRGGEAAPSVQASSQVLESAVRGFLKLTANDQAEVIGVGNKLRVGDENLPKRLRGLVWDS